MTLKLGTPTQRRRRRLGVPLTIEDWMIRELIGFTAGIDEVNICDALKDVSGIQDQRDAKLILDRMRRRMITPQGVDS